MLYETLPGLSFWLNWVSIFLLVVLAGFLVVAYNIMARSAPALEYGQRRDEHVLHYPRYVAAFLAAFDFGVAAALLVVPINWYVGWLLAGVSIVLGALSYVIAWSYLKADLSATDE